MALIRRISRLLAADMHAVLDQIEEPEAVLRQSIREMEEALATQARRTQACRTGIEAAAARIKGLERARADLDAKLDTCFADGNESLARKLTRRKLEAAELAERLAARRASLEDELAEHETLVAGNRDELDSMRQKAELLFGARAAHGHDAASCEKSRVAVDDDDVELAFLREKQARSRS